MRQYIRAKFRNCFYTKNGNVIAFLHWVSSIFSNISKFSPYVLLTHSLFLPYLSRHIHSRGSFQYERTRASDGQKRRVHGQGPPERRNSRFQTARSEAEGGAATEASVQHLVLHTHTFPLNVHSGAALLFSLGQKRSCPGCSWLVCCAFALIPRNWHMHNLATLPSRCSMELIRICITLKLNSVIFLMFSESWRIKDMQKKWLKNWEKLVDYF